MFISKSTSVWIRKLSFCFFAVSVVAPLHPIPVFSLRVPASVSAEGLPSYAERSHGWMLTVEAIAGQLRIVCDSLHCAVCVSPSLSLSVCLSFSLSTSDCVHLHMCISISVCVALHICL